MAQKKYMSKITIELQDNSPNVGTIQATIKGEGFHKEAFFKKSENSLRDVLNATYKTIIKNNYV